ACRAGARLSSAPATSNINAKYLPFIITPYCSSESEPDAITDGAGSKAPQHFFRQRAELIHRHHVLLRRNQNRDRGHAGWFFYGHGLSAVRTWFRRNERGAENG